MPLYEYRCEACGETEEKLEPLSAPLEHRCSKCGAELGMKRQVSQTAFTLHGDGWYSSGYGSAPSQSSSEPAKPAASGGCCGGCCPHAH